MTGEVLVGVIEALQGLQGDLPGTQQREFARISKRGEIDIVISTVPGDDLKSLPGVDVREYVDAAGYTDPTKKGVRFSWEKLVEVIALMQTQARRLGTNASEEKTLFPLARPKWVEKAQEPNKSSSRDAVVAELLPNGPKEFPRDLFRRRKRLNAYRACERAHRGGSVLRWKAHYPLQFWILPACQERDRRQLYFLCPSPRA